MKLVLRFNDPEAIKIISRVPKNFRSKVLQIALKDFVHTDKGRCLFEMLLGEEEVEKNDTGKRVNP